MEEKESKKENLLNGSLNDTEPIQTPLKKELSKEISNHIQNGKANHSQSPKKEKSIDQAEKPQKSSSSEDLNSKFSAPEIWPEKNVEPKAYKKKKSKLKLGSVIDKSAIFGVLSKIGLLLLGYFISFMEWTIVLLPLTVFGLVYYEQKKGSGKKIKAKAKACSSTKEQLLEKLEELPSWVMFPDRERAEWINVIVLQLWPNINSYLVKFIKSKLEPKIRKKHQSFRFEEIDFGRTPPKIDGVKVYDRTATRDSVLIDFDVFYDGDCVINFSFSGAQIGRLKDFQLSVEMRLVLKPLMLKAPIVGGVQIFFLNTPDIDFTLEGLTGIPGLSHFIRTKLEEKLRKKIVYPNKVTKRFTKSVEATELKSLEPEGVLRIHVIEAKDLERRDVTGKSDPYIILSVGAQEYKSAVIKRSLNPKWDEWCEFVILDPAAQQVRFKLYDQDDLNEDDFLGSGVVDIKRIYDGERDIWFHLEGVKHGELHLRFTWMSLTKDYNALDKALHEVKLLKVESLSTALLTIYVDSIKNIPRVKSFKKPDPYLILQVGDSTQQKSKVKKHTTDPIFEQGFSFLIKNPETDKFKCIVMDKQTNTKVDQYEYSVSRLSQKPNMEVSMIEFPLKGNAFNTTMIASYQLRVLTSESFDDLGDSSESYSDNELSRENSIKSLSDKDKTDSKSVNPSQIVVPETPVDIEPPVLTNTVLETTASPVSSPLLKRFKSMRRTSSRNSDSPKHADTNLGKIQIALQYSERRQKLMVTIFRITNLPLKDPKHIPDPYVKVKLSSPAGVTKNKTKTIMDNCNPEFKETFEYLLSPVELKEQKLTVTIKTKKKLFSNNHMGQVYLELKDVDLFSNDVINKWYDIAPETHSD